MTRFMFLRFSHREAKKRRHRTGQAGDLFEPPYKTSTVTYQKATELENVYVPYLEKVTTTFHHTEPSSLPLEINTVKKSSATLDIYGESKKDQKENIIKKIIESFKSYYNDIEKHQIHNYYLWKRSKCTEISSTILEKVPKKNKFQNKWTFDPELSKCEETGIWCLTYIEGKGMFCGLCKMTNTLQPSNNSKVWNSEASTRFRTEAVRDHFKKSREEEILHDDAISTEKIR